MSGLILHHYDGSPYSEKVRAIFGYKQLPWRSVITPALLPKPDLVALTGGYRKAPVLQLGRDIYCDTRLMVRLLDGLHPEPPLQPAHLKASCRAFASLEQTLFFATVPNAFQPAGLKFLAEQLGPEVMPRFSEDRKLLFSGGQCQRPNPAFAKLNFLPASLPASTRSATCAPGPSACAPLATGGRNRCRPSKHWRQHAAAHRISLSTARCWNRKA
jgi:hypothetical protein